MRAVTFDPRHASDVPLSSAKQVLDRKQIVRDDCERAWVAGDPAPRWGFAPRSRRGAASVGVRALRPAWARDYPHGIDRTTGLVRAKEARRVSLGLQRDLQR